MVKSPPHFGRVEVAQNEKSKTVGLIIKNPRYIAIRCRVTIAITSLERYIAAVDCRCAAVSFATKGPGEKRQENKSLGMRLFRNAAVALCFAAAGWGDRVALALPRESEAGIISNPSGEARDLTCRNEVGVLLPGPTLQSFSGVANPSACCALCSTTKVCHYITQPLAEMYGGCMVVLKVL
eukprot:SAG31_NODE_5841_length_2301_cov_2.349228_1_plen_181_part_00